MTISTLIILALGLAMDAFAVAISNGLCYRDKPLKIGIITAITFGLFQGLMPFIGYLGGITFSKMITSIDHWIALILLSIIGLNMLKEAFSKPDNDCDCCKEFSYKLLAIQAIATSIDALAVGISFALLDVKVGIACMSIAIITTVCCLVGFMIGRKFGIAFKQKAEVFGGFILIGIGLKIFIEHMFL